MTNELAIVPSVEQIRSSSVPVLLEKVRPEWQAKSLIERVRRLLEVDPSSACQRLFNAAVHDLRDKVKIAGIDIAIEAAKQYKLPPLDDADSIDDYSTAKLIDLCYRMGLLSRPDWRRISRCYEIRRDLEHEDDEYEAGVEDCVYIFNTCIEVVLERDPIQLVKVMDFKQLIEQADAAVPDGTLLEDFESAPRPRQSEILKFLVSHALDKEISDVVQQNAYTCISYLRPVSNDAVLLEIGTELQNKAGRVLDKRTARVAVAAGVFGYLRKSARIAFFEGVFAELQSIGTSWTAHANHGEILRSFRDFGGWKIARLKSGCKY